MSAIDVPPVFGTPVELAGAEQELARRAAEGRPPKAPPIQWAHMSNLIIYCDGMEAGARLAAEVSAIVAAHPTRVLLLVRTSALQEMELAAGVRTWCKPGRDGQMICTGQISLLAGGPRIAQLPYAVRSLLLGSLPTNVYWAAPVPPPLGGTLLHDLIDRAQQVIYDSQGWPEPARGLAATVAWLGKFEHRPVPSAWRVVSDLNWRRLKYWRRLIGQALDPVTSPGALDTITDVLLEHGPHAVTQAWGLASWLAARLGWQINKGRFEPGVQVVWQCQAPHGLMRLHIHRLADRPSEITRVRIACAINGTPVALSFVAESDNRLSVRVEGLDSAARTLTIQRPPISELLARQLSDREYDPVFHESMKVAQVLAQSVLQ